MAKGKYEHWLRKENLALLESWATERTDLELAEKIGITRSTLYQWIKTYPDISDAISRGRTDARKCAEVEETLGKRATGYTIELQKAIKVKRVEYDETTGRRLREVETVEYAIEQQHVPADVQAIKFFLTNRAPERWKNHVEVDGTITGQNFEEWLEKQNGKESGL